jgi:prepilin-type N-terminal cleavage/methylation domain-containing protein
MKTEFKAKFLQNISKKRTEEGFTLIELLVVIIIIGILSAIALPSFLNQANKAKQSEGKQYISSINKGQQAYYVENAVFGTSVDQLGLGLKTQTNNYTYVVGSAAGGASSGAGLAPNVKGLKTYVGGVGLVDVADAKGTATIICESTGVGTAPTTPTMDGSDAPTCPATTFTELK